MIDFTNNMLTSVPALPLTLNTVLLASNQIDTVAESDLPGLSSMSLCHNQLSSLPPALLADVADSRNWEQQRLVSPWDNREVAKPLWSSFLSLQLRDCPHGRVKIIVQCASVVLGAGVFG
jgi:hypothetical protein